MSKNYQRRQESNTAADKDEEYGVFEEAAKVESIESEVMVTPVSFSTPTLEPFRAISIAPVQPEEPITPPKLTSLVQEKETMLPIQSELLAFSSSINPKQPVEARWQYNLFQLLKNTIEKNDSVVFFQHWSAILKFYHEAKGTAFSDTYILRFSDEWPGSETEFSLFRRLVHIVSETSDPQTRRKAATMINFSRATESLTEDARNRLIGFYG